MTIAIKRDNGDLLWFDAVLTLGRQFSGTVSKHPLETGAVVTDHTTIDNEVINMSGVLSDADFNLRRPLIDAQQATELGLTNKQFVNNTPVTYDDVSGGSVYQNVTITDNGGVVQFLPESIGQFFGTQAPTVEVTDRSLAKPAIAVQADLITMFNDREQFTLLDFVGETISNAYTNCVMTSLSFSEDADSGDAVYPVMTIERVRYATSTSVRIKTRVSDAVSKKAATQQNKGKQVASGGTTSDATLNQNEPQKNSEKTRVSVLAGGL